MIGRRPLVTVRVEDPDGVAGVLARTHAAGTLLDLDERTALRLAAAAAEVAANAVRYAGGAAVELEVEEELEGPALVVRVVDRGPGLDDVAPDGLAGRAADAASETGGGGLARVRRLVERLAVVSSPGDGTTVVLSEPLPATSRGRTADGVAELAEILAAQEEPPFLAPRELLGLLDELAGAEREVVRLREEVDALGRDVPLLRRELAQTVETLDAVVAAAPLAIVVVDVDGRVTRWNAAAERIFGHAAADVLGRTLPLVPGDATEVLHADRAEVRAGESWQSEAHGRRLDGAALHVSIATAPLQGEDGRVRGRLAVVADVTERTRIEEERAKLLLAEQGARAEAEAVAERMRGVQAVTDAALAHLSLDDLLQELLERIRATLGVETIAVFLLSEGGDALVVRAFLGLDPEAVRRIRVPVARDAEGRIAIAREPFVIEDLREQAIGSTILEQRGIRSLAGVPLLVQGRETGVLHVGALEVGRFATDDVQLLQLVADRVGLAIEHARLYEAERGARQAAERAVERTAALQALTAALAGSLSSSDVAAVVIEHARAALGAVGVGIVVLDEATEELHPLATVGVSDALVEAWRRLPLATRGPVSDAIRGRRPVLLGSTAELRRSYPDAIVPDREERAVAVVPLVLERRAAGALVLMWPGERRAVAGDRTFLAAVADVCAQALERARLLEAEREARTESELVRERIAVLADAGAVLASSLDYGSTLPALARLLVPRVADIALVELVTTGMTPIRAGWAHRDAVREPALAERVADLTPLLASNPVGEALRTGRPKLLPTLGEDDLGLGLRTSEDETSLDAIGVPGSALVVPLIARGRTLGALLLLYTSSGRRYGPSDVAFAEDLARRAAAALDNARLYEDRARVARTLQRSLLPHRLPDVAGLELAARYRPAGGGTDVGGDFYDVFEVAGGSYVVVMGDVCGKGADAAALTGLIRWTVRATAMRERDPATVLTMLNEAVLGQTTDFRFATVVCARVDPTPGGARFTVACGGHPQPLVLRAAGDVQAAGVPGSLIGALEHVEVADRAVDLGPGDAVVLFTDGVTEERDPAGRPFGEEGLAELLRRSAGVDAEALAGRIEDEVSARSATAPRDDIAVLVLRVPPTS